MNLTDEEIFEKKRLLLLEEKQKKIDQNRIKCKEYAREYRLYERDIIARNQRNQDPEFQKARKLYRDENNEIYTLYRSTYYSEHKEKELEYSRSYYKTNRERCLEYAKDYYQKHKERMKLQAFNNYHSKKLNRLQE